MRIRCAIGIHDYKLVESVECLLERTTTHSGVVVRKDSNLSGAAILMRCKWCPAEYAYLTTGDQQKEIDVPYYKAVYSKEKE